MSPFAEDILTDETYTLITILIDSLPPKLIQLYNLEKLEEKDLFVLEKALSLLKQQVDHQMSLKQRSKVAKERNKNKKKNKGK